MVAARAKGASSGSYLGGGPRQTHADCFSRLGGVGGETRRVLRPQRGAEISDLRQIGMVRIRGVVNIFWRKRKQKRYISSLADLAICDRYVPYTSGVLWRLLFF